MMKSGYFIRKDPETVEMNFYSPIYFYICKYGDRPGDERIAMVKMKKQMEEFYDIYRQTSVNR